MLGGVFAAGGEDAACDEEDAADGWECGVGGQVLREGLEGGDGGLI